jgi:hypothetical protein
VRLANHESKNKMKYWGGFVDDKLNIRKVNDGFGGENFRSCPAVFTSRKEARRQYNDVRKLKILKAGKSKRK